MEIWLFISKPSFDLHLHGVHHQDLALAMATMTLITFSRSQNENLKSVLNYVCRSNCGDGL